MKLQDVNKIQGANKLVRQWNSMKDATEAPQAIMLQSQGARHMNANMQVDQSDPEFEVIWTALKALVDRKYEAQVKILDDAGVESPDVNPRVLEKVRADKVKP